MDKDNNWDAILERIKNGPESYEEDKTIPKYTFDILGATVFWNHKEMSNWSVETLDSEPYARADENPMIFLDLGRLSLIFENKLIWKTLRRIKK